MIIKAVSSFFLGLYLLNLNAEVSAQPNLSKIRQTYSLASQNEDVGSNLSPANPVRPAALEPKLFKRVNRWTFEEEGLLLKLREEQQLSWKQIQEEYFPERSWKALQIRFYRLTKDPSQPKVEARRPWTDEEKELLFKLRESNLSWAEIVESFPGRSKSALVGKYRSLTYDRSAPGVFQKKWTAEENELLLKLGKEGMPWKERVKFFDNRTLRALQTQYKKLVPSRQPPPRLFTSEEDDFIIKAIDSDNMPVKDISLSLGRSIQGVHRRIRKLQESNRLDPNTHNLRYSDAELELIAKLVKQNVSFREIATKHLPGRSREAIKQAYKRFRERKRKEGESE